MRQTGQSAVPKPSKSLGAWLDPDTLRLEHIEYRAMLEYISLMKRGVAPKIRKAGGADDGDGEDVNGGDGGDGGDGGGGGGRRKLRKENERLRKERNRLNSELERATKRQRQNQNGGKTEKPAGYTGDWCDTCADRGRRPDACKHRKQECAFENDACFR